jgi:hypothetical protein
MSDLWNLYSDMVNVMSVGNIMGIRDSCQDVKDERKISLNNKIVSCCLVFYNL